MMDKPIDASGQLATGEFRQVVGRGPQRTIARELFLNGRGLHTGAANTLRIQPAPADTGIVFIRTDLPHRPTISAASPQSIDPAKCVRRTTLSKDGVEIQTVEHFMAALWGAGIDNAYVEVAGEELPGFDGSAAPYLERLLAAGSTEQGAPRRQLVVREPVFVEEDDACIGVFPGRTLTVSYVLSYDHPYLKSQFVTYPSNGASFQSAIAPARTFCLQREADAIKAAGLGRGATYENTLVVGEQGVIDNTLRFEDEFARHKVLDLLGDLFLLGAHLQGRVIAVRSGHSLNAKLLKKLAQEHAQWRLGALPGASEGVVGPQLDVTQIEKILPHRYPFLLVDRIVELSGTRAVGLKNVTMNEYFFRGHFPGRPIMPGVLIVEAMAQVGGIVLLNKPEHHGRFAYFMAIDKVKFRKPVVPGDQLVFEVELGKVRSRTGQVIARALVDGKLVCEAELMFALSD